MIEPSKEATDLWVALNFAQRTIYRAIDCRLKAEGLPPLRWYDVLWELDRSRDGLRPFELERRLIFEQSNLSRLLRRTVDEGLVEERPHRKDGRGKVLHITKNGHRLRQQMWKIYGPQIQAHVGRAAENHDARAAVDTLTALIE